MDGPSLVSRAKAGDAAAIAALINRTLQPQGFQVEGDRQGHTLTLWVSGATLPPEVSTVAYLRQGIERLHSAQVREVYIYGGITGQRGGWRKVIRLPAAETSEMTPEMTPGAIAPQPFQPSVPPHGSDLNSSGLNGPDTITVALPTPTQAIRSGKSKAVPVPSPTPQPPIAPPENGPPLVFTVLPPALQRQGLAAQVVIRRDQLCVYLPAARCPYPAKTLALVYTTLEQFSLKILGIDQLATLAVYGTSGDKKVVWQRRVPLPRQDSLSAENTDLFSFQNRYSNAYIFPALLLLGGVMNASNLVNALLFGIKIWFHEFGHATVAWLGGRRALPLPFGWTAVDPQRSLFVYGGVLVLLGLLFWSGRREGQKWPMILAVGLGGLQFIMTWLMSPTAFDMWVSFGGIGGEFYLCALLIISFFFPLPKYWRWDFYRYPAVLGAAFCFWGQFWLWKRIAQGQATIPWGAMWGDPGHGDMNRLVSHGWSTAQITGTYNAIGNICLVAIAAVYLYICWRHHYQTLLGLWLRWLAQA